MIGVDIVDHSVSFTESKHPFELLKKKILLSSEWGFAATKHDLNQVWAIKESAYKVWSQHKKDVFQNPHNIQILANNMQAGKWIVSVKGFQILTDLMVMDTYSVAISRPLHCLCTYSYFISSMHESVATHEWNHFFGVGPNHVECEFHELGFINRIKHQNKPFHYSRSHHGRYYLSAILA